MKNKWKIGFLVLLGINLLLAIIFFSMIMFTPADPELKKPKELTGDYVSFHVNSNKYDLNRLVNHYLLEETADSAIKYRVIMGDEVELYGKISVFSEQINMKLTFEPEALKNGDLVLKQKNMSIGKMPLPISYVLKFISENYQFPKGVEIRPNDKQIYVHMQKLKLKSDMQIKADTFDLKKDHISFTILVPVK